ncbi:hypothetical protein CPB84DRAFT_1750395 [Gymnopilus junonius]|uniref:DUF6532 domain-containing protein n=1 Tax=Gymnopilus junonius TaxID=109634 RepID=A0A9P5NG77_GYMJU|nr:hypothetical protein CPB84DRAFT_1750395 [Gymnopilus junonius]
MPPKPSDAAARFQSIMSTRSKNKVAHPGQPDAPQKRRNREEMAEHRAQVAHARDAKKQANESNVHAAAAIKDRMRREDVECNAPQPATTQPMFRPPARASSAASDVADVAPLAEPSDENQNNNEPEPRAGEKDVVTIEGDPDDDGDDSDAYVPRDDDGGDESEVDVMNVHRRPRKRRRMNRSWSIWHDQGVAGIRGREAGRFPWQAKNDADDSLVRAGGFVGDGETDDVECLRGKVHGSHSRTFEESSARWRQEGEAQAPSRGAAAVFKEKLQPLIKILAGTQPPWGSLSVPQIQSLVDEVFDTGSYTVEHDDTWCDLVAYRLSNWRNSFRNYANEVVAGTCKSLRMPAIPQNNLRTEKFKRKGLFQNYLIVYTLAKAHFSEFEIIRDPRTLPSDEMPVGALILALQAVENAFKYWAEGQYNATAKFPFDANTYDDKRE